MGRSRKTGHDTYVLAEIMTMSDLERRRLGALSSLRDPGTLALCHELGVACGWRCMEIGAGSGTVAFALAAMVGQDGQVLATDIDLRYLPASPPAQLQFLRHDIVNDPPLVGRWQLVHARIVLEHLAEPAAVVDRMADRLAPGGWLLLEEFDLRPHIVEAVAGTVAAIEAATFLRFATLGRSLMLVAGAQPDVGENRGFRSSNG